MDECLPLGSLDASTLRMLLEKERSRTAELEREVWRLQAALARQNEVILRLEQRDAERQREVAELRTLVAGLTEQNALLRQQVAQLAQENARLRGMPLAPPPDPAPESKPATPERALKIRKKRAAEHNGGRLKTERANRWVNHAAEQCPRCGEPLSEGWIIRRVPVIELPPIAPLEITEHRIIRRQCPRCGKRVLPKPVGREAGRMGRCRFGPRLIATIATLRTVERLPIRVIQERLWREYGLRISRGGIVGLLARMATAGRPAYEQLQADVRASPVVHADETVWREQGQQTTVWTTSTAQLVYLHHGRRTNEAIDGILGADFAGTIVADCYAAYDHFTGPKQRCWAHLVRELKGLLHDQGGQEETVAWVEGILAVYDQARAARPPAEEGATPQAARAREARARRCEALVLLLCPAEPDPSLAYATLAKRLRKHLTELFTFVRDPEVQPTNNAAERTLRPLVIARKISGGTRSPAGSTTRMVLQSLCATARLQGKDPTAVCQQLLLSPPGAPSPLAAPLPEIGVLPAQSHAS
jgi:ribosomal protein S27AE